MPCTSYEYVITEYDRKMSETVSNLIYVQNKLKIKNSKELIKASSSTEFSKPEGDKWTEQLCTILTKMPKTQREQLVYDAKSAKSRRLADWWEEHQEHDKQRKAAEKKEKQEKKNIQNALSKLTAKERKLLNLK